MKSHEAVLKFQNGFFIKMNDFSYLLLSTF
jgi:hypothetical protein